jgi:hypothetical protein
MRNFGKRSAPALPLMVVMRAAARPIASIHLLAFFKVTAVFAGRTQKSRLFKKKEKNIKTNPVCVVKEISKCKNGDHYGNNTKFHKCVYVWRVCNKNE